MVVTSMKRGSPAFSFITMKPTNATTRTRTTARMTMSATMPPLGPPSLFFLLLAPAGQLLRRWAFSMPWQRY